jgi:putative glutamine amidotransferase
VVSNASDARRPVIGLTTYLEHATCGVWETRASFLPNAYIESVTRVGGTVVLLPPQPVDAASIERVVAGLDGLILTGGKDVDPDRYGQSRHDSTDEPRHDRDAWEFALLGRALEVDLPVLGICRGAQILNVLRGGTLHQHLPEVVGDNRYQLGGGVFSRVPTTVDQSSRLASILGPEVDATVYHHQAIDILGSGLVRSAVTADGIVEAIELPDARFTVAVQWHPEEDADDPRLFAALVAAAGAPADHSTAEGVAP